MYNAYAYISTRMVHGGLSARVHRDVSPVSRDDQDGRLTASITNTTCTPGLR